MAEMTKQRALQMFRRQFESLPSYEGRKVTCGPFSEEEVETTMDAVAFAIRAIEAFDDDTQDALAI